MCSPLSPFRRNPRGTLPRSRPYTSRLANEIVFQQGGSMRAVIHKNYDALDRLQLIETRDGQKSAQQQRLLAYR